MVPINLCKKDAGSRSLFLVVQMKFDFSNNGTTRTFDGDDYGYGSTA